MFMVGLDELANARSQKHRSLIAPRKGGIHQSVPNDLGAVNRLPTKFSFYALVLERQRQPELVEMFCARSSRAWRLPGRRSPRLTPRFACFYFTFDARRKRKQGN